MKINIVKDVPQTKEINIEFPYHYCIDESNCRLTSLVFGRISLPEGAEGFFQHYHFNYAGGDLYDGKYLQIKDEPLWELNEILVNSKYKISAEKFEELKAEYGHL